MRNKQYYAKIDLDLILPLTLFVKRNASTKKTILKLINDKSMHQNFYHPTSDNHYY